MINVLNLREEYGYSQFELSFLMGSHDFYVRDIENPFHTLQYSVPNNGYLMRIFKCGIDQIVPAKLLIIEASIHRVSTATNQQEKLVFKVEKLGDDGKWVTLKTFSEEPKDMLLDIPSRFAEEEVKNWVIRKFEKATFLKRPKTALEILNACEKDLDGPVRPLFLASALKRLYLQEKITKAHQTQK